MTIDAGQGGLVAYFGYGSLVNRATHRTEIVGAVPARLRGWRRQWVRRDAGTERALLSVSRMAGISVDGLLVFDRAENLPAVDLREALYERIALDPSEIETAGRLPGGCPLYLYQAVRPPEATRLQILQSYLDAVMQGFLREHGEAGLARFVAETEGFEAIVLADRDVPSYPRSVPLAAGEPALFDALLATRIHGFAPMADQGFAKRTIPG